jgi:hypothetical protein
VSKWKLYKTARKRGIYAEIKKQNQAHVSLFRSPCYKNILLFSVEVFMNVLREMGGYLWPSLIGDGWPSWREMGG